MYVWEGKTDRSLFSCTSVLDQHYLPSSFVTIIYDGQLPNLFSQVFTVCGAGTKKESDLVSYGMEEKQDQGMAVTLSTVPCLHKTEPKQAPCQAISVRSCTTSEASVYKI